MRKSADKQQCGVRAAVPRQVSTSASIQQLQKVKNMRDLAEVCSGIAPGTLQTLKTLQLTKSLAHECDKTCFKCCYKAAALLIIGRILRSACPTSANQQDVDIVRQQLKITHLVSFLWCALSVNCCHVMQVIHCHRSAHFAIE